MATTVPGFVRRKERGRLDKCLGLITDVEAGEGWDALLLAANICCLLASYYLLKTARESLILSEGNAEVKSYAAGAQALILCAAVPLYGIVASRVDRNRLINGVLLFFVSQLAIFYALVVSGCHVAVAFFLWVGVFNVMIVTQFWAFANDVYTVERGQRLFPLVGVGGSLGAWIGARMASALMAAHRQPADLFMLAGAGVLVCIGLNCYIARRGTHRAAPESGGSLVKQPGAHGGFRLILGDRYLRLIAALVILVNAVNSTGEYLLGRVVAAQASRAIAEGTAGTFSQSQLIAIFYADFFGWVNLVSLAIQLLVVSRLFKRVGVAGALFVLPLIAGGSSALFAFIPFFGAVRVAKILENSTDYSLQNTARQALYLPTCREAKFKAKQAIDSLSWRVGDAVQATIVFVGVRYAFDIRQFAILNEVFVVLWLLVVVSIYREHKRQALALEAHRQAA